MKIKYKLLSAVAIISALAIVSGCGCKDTNPKQYKINLEVWGFDDTSDTFAEIIDTFKKTDPNIESIEYKKLSADTYKKELIDAMAAGQGPDVFAIHNTWLPSFSDKIVPAPKETVSEQKLKKDFVDVVANDFLSEGSVWALPLSVDSLGLYYNKDFFNAASITSPPKSWDDFVADIGILTKVDNFGEISRSGASLGTAYNINRATDVLNLMMIQNGTEMTDKDGIVSFDRSKIVDGKSVSPGENALTFYTDFARTGSSKYTWNRNMHYSIDAFSEGNLAMMFNYSWHIKTIESKSPKLNFAVAPIPQFPGSTPSNFANYWAYGVAKNKTSSKNSANVTNDIRANEAWKFIAFLTTKAETPIQVKSNVAGTTKITNSNYDPASVYLEKTGKPAARRDLIEAQKTDPKIGVFATDNLIAKSWKQADPDAIGAIFSEMIDQVNRGQSNVRDAIQSASKRVQQLYKK
jgi:multiple sugar transport system substrate-binding protein